jgi:hypothetical protein
MYLIYCSHKYDWCQEISLGRVMGHIFEARDLMSDSPQKLQLAVWPMLSVLAVGGWRCCRSWIGGCLGISPIRPITIKGSSVRDVEGNHGRSGHSEAVGALRRVKNGGSDGRLGELWGAPCLLQRDGAERNGGVRLEKDTCKAHTANCIISE